MSASVYVGKNVTVELWNAAETTQLSIFTAQEVTFDAKQAIEAVDQLSSDLIAAWGPGLKTFEGSLKELLRSKDQLDRLAPFQATLTEYVLKIIDDTGVAGQKITTKLTGVIFPEGSIPHPKNAPVYITTKYLAKNATVSVA